MSMITTEGKNMAWNMGMGTDNQFVTGDFHFFLAGPIQGVKENSIGQTIGKLAATLDAPPSLF